MPSLPFLGSWQTLQTQIRCRKCGSDQGQHFQNTGISIKNKTKNEKSTPDTP